MERPNSFEVLKEMAKQNKNIRLAPLGNIISAKSNKKGGEITIGVEASVIADFVLKGSEAFVGGLILADRKEFEETQKFISATN